MIKVLYFKNKNADWKELSFEDNLDLYTWVDEKSTKERVFSLDIDDEIFITDNGKKLLEYLNSNLVNITCAKTITFSLYKSYNDAYRIANEYKNNFGLEQFKK